MSNVVKAYVGAQIHDGLSLYEDSALVLGHDGGLRVEPRHAVPAGCPTDDLRSGLIMPGFVDLQVNGGGGVMFNDDQSVATLKIIANAHATTGTLALLPTLITDTPSRTRAAIDAVEQAIVERVDGIVGIHLEGPHLSVARKGAHDPKLIRQMSEEDLAVILNAAQRLPNVMVTVAPENTSLAQIRSMTEAGIIVSLGHTDANAATCHASFDAGARCVTHLFNAMSQMGNREPGLVGATLEREDIYAGLIADTVHVHPAMIRIALAAKPHSERVFLVTDAMAAAGSDIESFMLNGREVFRKEGRLTLEDNTLAGADLSMPQALSVMLGSVREEMSNAVARATSTPAGLLRDASGMGRLGGTAETALYFKDGLGQPPVMLGATVAE
jgi:N-acetylglucosamine-6-phosphate deacetylase